MKRFLALGFFLISLSAAHADIVKIKGGKTFEGRLLHEDEQTVRLLLYSGEEQSWSRSQVESIQKKKSKYDQYDERASQTPDTADGHCKLAAWCKSQGLSKLYEAEIQKALQKNPDYEPARKLLGQKKLGDRWVSEAEWAKAKAAEKSKLAGVTEIKLVVGVEVDMTKEQLDALAQRFKEAAAKMWECCEGNLWISSIQIKDKSKEGNVHIENADKVNTNKGPYGYASPSGIWLGGQFPLITFCHEMSHYLFSLPEEYDEPKCSECVMEPWAMKFQYCDANNHNRARKNSDCWSAIRSNPKYRNWKHPNKDFGAAPETAVGVTDQ